MTEIGGVFVGVSIEITAVETVDVFKAVSIPCTEIRYVPAVLGVQETFDPV